MTTAGTAEQPGRETAAAFAFPAGGLLLRRSYTLTRADALAFLRLRREWPGLAKWLLGLWVMVGGVAAAFLPGWITGPEGSLQSVLAFLVVVIGQILLVIIGRAIWRQVRARQMVPTPRPAVFECWTDGIVATPIDGATSARLSPELIGQIAETPRHIFILNADTRIVLPKRAFASADEASAMAAHLREWAQAAE